MSWDADSFTSNAVSHKIRLDVRGAVTRPSVRVAITPRARQGMLLARRQVRGHWCDVTMHAQARKLEELLGRDGWRIATRNAGDAWVSRLRQEACSTPTS